MRVLVAGGLLALCACGRLGYESRRGEPDAAIDASVDAATDAPTDAAPVCPAGTTEISAGAAVCIEQAQRGSLTWTDAKADCESLGRRLCADAEWATACVNAVGMQAMINDDWEWVAEESGGVAGKRGNLTCDDISSHEIFVDPYGYRCCVAKQ